MKPSINLLSSTRDIDGDVQYKQIKLFLFHQKAPCQVEAEAQGHFLCLWVLLSDKSRMAPGEDIRLSEAPVSIFPKVAGDESTPPSVNLFLCFPVKSV